LLLLLLLLLLRGRLRQRLLVLLRLLRLRLRLLLLRLTFALMQYLFFCSLSALFLVVLHLKSSGSVTTPSPVLGAARGAAAKGGALVGAAGPHAVAGAGCCGGTTKCDAEGEFVELGQPAAQSGAHCLGVMQGLTISWACP
jgi:hypothetical protein